MQVASEQVVSSASRHGAPSVPALPLRGESPDLTALLRRPAWMADALCREYPNLSFLGDSQAAKRVCRRCLVREECMAFGFDHEVSAVTEAGAGVGIYGGLSAADRRRVLHGESVAELLASEQLEVSEAAAVLGVTRATVVRWTFDGRLESTCTTGGHRRYMRADVEALREAMAR